MATPLALEPALGVTARKPAPAHPRTWKGGLGKYREIVIAVAFFLLFDLGVLVLNFYTSFRIAEDAVGINLAGRQRMLSQRTAKALYALESGMAKEVPVAAELDELRAAVRLFDATLKAFQSSGTVTGGDGRPVYLQAVTSASAVQALAEAQRIWAPYQERLAPVLAGTASADQVARAVDYARQHNLRLLGLMNDLTTALESHASERATVLRQVQTGGIVLALLNFVFILFKFLRRLRSSDAAIEAANEENREILQSVREGLFLLTPDLTLGSQISESVHRLFGRHARAGESFLGLLEPLVSEKTLADARSYVELLFAPHVKAHLAESINPLSEVEVTSINRLGETSRRYLSFRFNRVYEGDRVRHLLVTVQDVTERVELQSRLNEERLRAQRELSTLLRSFEADPAQMRQFVERGERTLLEVNDLLRSTSDAAGKVQILRTIDGIYRRIHAFKGDASALGLDMLAGVAHQFEGELQRLKDTGAASNETLLSLPLPLEDLLGKLAALKALASARRGDASSDGVERAWRDLAMRVASDLGRSVHATVSVETPLPQDAQRAALLQEIAVQLVRNAVVHGIEPPEQRSAAGKDPTGRVDVALLSDGQGGCVLNVRDDGGGLSAEQVRRRLVQLGWYDAEQATELSDRQVLAHIFRPGFSTAQQAGMHGGRGVGLDLVQANAAQLGARLSVSTVAGRYTEFRVSVPA
jgi:HPt (histidine-containing phosphotransfer) domain-containing protein